MRPCDGGDDHDHRPSPHRLGRWLLIYVRFAIIICSTQANYGWMEILDRQTSIVSRNWVNFIRTATATNIKSRAYTKITTKLYDFLALISIECICGSNCIQSNFCVYEMKLFSNFLLDLEVQKTWFSACVVDLSFLCDWYRSHRNTGSAKMES